jgi:outer membrane protein OmpA-like peptidoglycan-associated protein
LRVYAFLTSAPSVRTAWPGERERRVVAERILQACETGRLVALRPKRMRRTHGGQAHVPKPKSVPPSEPPPGTKPKPNLPTFFEVCFTDEIGEPIPAVAIAFDVAGKKPSVTDGAGLARLDGVNEQHGSVTATDLDGLREQLRPRWDQIREEEWLEPAPDHTFAPLKEGRLVGASILSETLHTVVVQPWCIRARLIGMFFDTNKAFLLPSAMGGIRGVKHLYDENLGSELLIVGHTDTTGDPSYNDPLSVERAESVAAYLIRCTTGLVVLRRMGDS